MLSVDDGENGSALYSTPITKVDLNGSRNEQLLVTSLDNQRVRLYTWTLFHSSNTQNGLVTGNYQICLGKGREFIRWQNTGRSIPTEFSVVPMSLFGLLVAR
ncbi:Hypothetical protein CINCED_3A018003 [Cinara cedri]|uniref:Uncharacterized protein n=1 Tax=Cinara cedri TaxID=506608 RepID=A0A5E4MKC5_9HEMI|nr:Hypothetical protein CINCED_3A018003 [Cinara cedri]